VGTLRVPSGSWSPSPSLRNQELLSDAWIARGGNDSTRRPEQLYLAPSPNLPNSPTPESRDVFERWGQTSGFDGAVA
jgi:hypothetical protein